MTERSRWPGTLYPKPDVITAFVMSVTAVSRCAVDSELRQSVLAVAVGDEYALAGIFIVVTTVGFSLWIPFARRDFRLFCYFSVALQALGLAGLYGYRILSVLGADAVPI